MFHQNVGHCLNVTQENQDSYDGINSNIAAINLYKPNLDSNGINIQICYLDLDQRETLFGSPSDPKSKHLEDLTR